MKISLALSALILAIGASLSWRDEQRFAVARNNHTHLVAKAATLGIAADPARPSSHGRITKHGRPGKEGEVDALVADTIAFFKKIEASGETPGSSATRLALDPNELLDRVKLLNASQLKILIAELGSASDLKDEYRAFIVDFAVMQLAEDHPQTALALFEESPGLLKEDKQSRDHFVSSALNQWAKEDPTATAEWVRKNAEKLPDLITAGVKESMISSIAATDPKLAFNLVGGLGFSDTWPALCEIATAAKTPESRTATLSAIRDYLASLPEEKRPQDLIGRFTGPVAGEGFASASEWFAGAGFTPSELETVAGSLLASINKEDSGQWIKWVSEKLPAGKSEGPIRDIVERWTESDYQAAGKWLSSTPASPAKNAAIRSYAQTVSTLDPATATQWAMTLPPGPDRDATLKHIQDHPPTK